jgi:hypothetical protein
LEIAIQDGPRLQSKDLAEGPMHLPVRGIEGPVYGHSEHKKRCVCSLDAYIRKGLPAELEDQIANIEKLLMVIVQQHNLEEQIEQMRDFIAFCQYNPIKNQPTQMAWSLRQINRFEKWVMASPIYARLDEKNQERIVNAFVRCRAFTKKHSRPERRMLDGNREAAQKILQSSINY